MDSVIDIKDLEFTGEGIPAMLPKGKNLSDLAREVGISRQFMTQIVQGVRKPSTDVALRLAAALRRDASAFSRFNTKELRQNVS